MAHPLGQAAGTLTAPDAADPIQRILLSTCSDSITLFLRRSGSFRMNQSSGVPMDMDSWSGVPMDGDSWSGVPVDMDSWSGVPMDVDSWSGVPMDGGSWSGVPIDIDSSCGMIAPSVGFLSARSAPRGYRQIPLARKTGFLLVQAGQPGQVNTRHAVRRDEDHEDAAAGP